MATGPVSVGWRRWRGKPMDFLWAWDGNELVLGGDAGDDGVGCG